MSHYIAKDVTHLFNEILRTHASPSWWKKYVIVPIPKVSKVKGFSDFRPISVTSVLAHCFEKLLANKFTSLLFILLRINTPIKNQVQRQPHYLTFLQKLPMLLKDVAM